MATLQTPSSTTAAIPAIPAIPKTTLTDLPFELIQEIHLLALNPSFAHCHPYVLSALSHPNPQYAARYLLGLYESHGPDDIMVRAARHPVCTIPVAKRIRQLWDMKRGYHNRSPSPSDDGPSTPTATAPPLTCSELPRRMFRQPVDPETPILPLIQYLFSAYSPSANSHKGYPLCRAVLTSNHDLIAFLLAHGADPSAKAGLPVQIAISLRDVKAVRMLIERPEEEIGVDADDEKGRKDGRERRRKKRRRLSDRMAITPALVECALRKGSKDIVQYFVQEKGVMPPLRSILKLGQSQTSHNRLDLSPRTSRPRPSQEPR